LVRSCRCDIHNFAGIAVTVVIALGLLHGCGGRPAMERPDGAGPQGGDVAGGQDGSGDGARDAGPGDALGGDTTRSHVPGTDGPPGDGVSVDAPGPVPSCQAVTPTGVIFSGQGSRTTPRFEQSGLAVTGSNDLRLDDGNGLGVVGGLNDLFIDGTEAVYMR